MRIWSKMWPLECSQGFPLIWPHDLLFHPTWPSFKRILVFIETNILTMFDENQVENVTARVFTRFSFNLTPWPTLWPTWPSFERNLVFIETNILTEFDENRVENVTSRVFTRFSLNLTPWPTFWPHLNQFRKVPSVHWDKHSDQVWQKSGQKCDL